MHPPVPPAPPKACGLAVTSLVCGCLGFVLAFLAGIPAIITGHMALGKIKRSGGTIGGSGIATTGLVLGYVTTALTVVWLALAALATPAIYKALERADMAENVSHARQLQMGLQVYAMDHDGKFPPGLQALADDGYVLNPDGLRYTESKSKTRHDWTYFAGHTTTDAPDTIIIAAPMTTPDGTKRVVAFLDGSARALPEAEYQRLIHDQQPAEAAP